MRPKEEQSSMRRSRIIVAMAAAALAAPALVISTASAEASQQSSQGAATSYLVLAKAGGSAQAMAQQLRAGGAAATSINHAIGLLTVTATDTAVAARTRGLTGVYAVAPNRSIGYTAKANASPNVVEQEAQLSAGIAASPAVGKGARPGDPFDSLLWGMDMINAPAAHAIERGDQR